MPDTDDILKITDADEFDRAAMEVFRRQARECAPYGEYLAAIGISPAEIERISDSGKIEDIPFLPIEVFKTRKVYCGECEPEAVFTSSGTGGGGSSRHYVASLAGYEKTYTRGFELFYGDPAYWSIYALLPSYLEREGSSLVLMADGLIKQGRGGGFYLHDHEKLLRDMEGGMNGFIEASIEAGLNESDDRRDNIAVNGKILLGVSYALLDLAEELSAKGTKLPPGTIVMETGGMKGKRPEMSKERMHEILSRAFGVAEIHSEYGMAELMSQAYSRGGGIFRTPPWMRIAVRDLRDPFDVRYAGGNERAHGSENGMNGIRGGGSMRGGINIIDLANLHSCAFIATQDVGTLNPDGSFTIDGRVSRSEIRGCNLLIQ